jgi:hypothetical protein
MFVGAALLSAGALAEGKPWHVGKRAGKPPAKAPVKARVPLLIEQRAIDLIKAASARLATAKAMSFAAGVDVEYPSKIGPPLAYPVRYDVAMQRFRKVLIS